MTETTQPSEYTDSWGTSTNNNTAVQLNSRLALYRFTLS